MDTQIWIFIRSMTFRHHYDVIVSCEQKWWTQLTAIFANTPPRCCTAAKECGRHHFIYSLLARRHHWFFRYLSRWPVLNSSLMIRVYVGDINVDISHDSLIIRQHRRVSSYPIWKLKATHTALSVFRWFVSLGFTNENSKSREHKGLLPPVLNVCLWIILRWFLFFFNLLFKFLVAIGRFRRYEIVSWNALNCLFFSISVHWCWAGCVNGGVIIYLSIVVNADLKWFCNSRQLNQSWILDLLFDTH
jgi:hypothetical protein